MAFPTRFPDWATEDEVSPAGAPNKTPVPDEFKLSGLKAEEPMPRAYFNDQLHLMGLWVRELKTQFDDLVVESSTAIIQQIYPVGAYWMSDGTETPDNALGFGTWERVAGRFLVGLDPLDSQFDGIGETGGSKTHTHTDNLTVPSHSHTITSSGWGAAQVGGNLASPTTSGQLVTGSGKSEVSENFESLAHANTTKNTSSTTVELTGSINTSSNLPPFKTTNIWVRTA